MECKICMQDFDENNRIPYTLNPCGHYFCIICLNSLPSKLCPLDRLRIDGKIVNRAILDMLSMPPVLAQASSNATSNASSNTTRLKHVEYLERTFFGKLEHFEKAYNNEIIKKLSESQSVFEALRKKIDENTDEKIQKLLCESEKLKAEVKLAEDNVNAQISKHATKEFHADIVALKRKLGKNFDLDLVKQECASLKETLEDECSELKNIKFKLRFRPAVLTRETPNTQSNSASSHSNGNKVVANLIGDLCERELDICVIS